MAIEQASVEQRMALNKRWIKIKQHELDEIKAEKVADLKIKLTKGVEDLAYSKKMISK